MSIPRIVGNDNDLLRGNGGVYIEYELRASCACTAERIDHP